MPDFLVWFDYWADSEKYSVHLRKFYNNYATDHSLFYKDLRTWTPYVGITYSLRAVWGQEFVSKAGEMPTINYRPTSQYYISKHIYNLPS